MDMRGIEIDQLQAELKQAKSDLRDCFNARQTIFHRCKCGRIAERGIICPTNREGGKCEAGE